MHPPQYHKISSEKTTMFLSISPTTTTDWLLIIVTLFPLLLLLLPQGGFRKILKGSDQGGTDGSANHNNNKKRQPPPRVPGLPIIGNLHQLGELPHRSLWKLSREFGPLMMLHLGRVPTLVVSSADVAKQVLKTHDSDCCGRPPSQGPRRLSYNFRDIAFSPPSDYWREMRKLFILEFVSERRAASLWRAREAGIARLIASLSNAADACDPPLPPVDLHEMIISFVDSILNVFAFGKEYPGGKRFKLQDVKCQDLLTEAQNMLHSFSAEQFFPYIGWVVDALTGLRARQNWCFRNLDHYFQMLIDEHLDPIRPKPECEDLVDVLLRLCKDDNFAFRLTHDHIKAILMNTFLGGTDSTALTIVWTMSELMANPRVMEKMQAEIRRCVGRKGKVERDDIPKLKYLRMVVKETLRMHPAGPLLLPHWTRNHIQIDANGCKYDVVPGTTILINAFAIGRDPESWEKAGEFYPERFEGGEIDFRGQSFELLPFGSGRRICPGITMGVCTVEFTLANLLLCFDWELPMGMKAEDIDIEEKGRLTIQRKTPLLLVPKLSTSNHSLCDEPIH